MGSFIFQLKTLSKIFLTFLRLGSTSFGGPVAHITYFHDEFVVQRKWIAEQAYAELVALCQFLPGPASSQVGIALGLSRGGYAGALAAWLGFTLPSALALTLLGLGVANFSGLFNHEMLHGLKIAAAAVVAHALWSMGTKLCPEKKTATLAAGACIAVTLFPSAWGQVAAIILGGGAALLLFKQSDPLPHAGVQTNVGRGAAVFSLALFVFLLLFLPLAAKLWAHQALRLFDSFFRAGSLVFGGGHVVLPLLQSEVVPTGWVSKDLFMAGYGAAQAVPGPLFTFTAYLGAVSKVEPNGWTGALICLTASFLPSFLLVTGALPLWEKIRTHNAVQRAMRGVNASVVGLLLSAFYHPVWTSAVSGAGDFAQTLGAFVFLKFWNVPPWVIVLASAGVGWMRGSL